MSYCRITDIGSDIYIYWDVCGAIHCSSCNKYFEDATDAIKHVEWHIENGDAVLDSVIPEIKGDIERYGADVIKWEEIEERLAKDWLPSKRNITNA